MLAVAVAVDVFYLFRAKRERDLIPCDAIGQQRPPHSKIFNFFFNIVFTHFSLTSHLIIMVEYQYQYQLFEQEFCETDGFTLCLNW